jgi:hypothetical protein
MAEDIVLRFRKVQVVVDGIDRCRVGFLQRHLVKHWKQYDGVLAQVIDVFSKDSASPTSRRKFHHNKGCCVASIISSVSEDTANQMSNQKRGAEPDSDDSDNDNSATKRQRTVPEVAIRDDVAQANHR